MPALTASKKESIKSRGYLLVLLSVFLLMLLFSMQILDSVRTALQLCYQSIIPSLFPFMILSELLSATFYDKRAVSPHLNAICRKIFAVPLDGMLAFLAGALCGFPIGVKITADLYRAGRLTVGEAEQLLSFANNTGPAFVIAGIGGGMLHSAKLGFFLYAVQIFSSLAAGCLIARLPVKKKEYVPSGLAMTQAKPHGFVSAVWQSVHNMLTVCGMITAFAVPVALIRYFTKNCTLLAFICSFLEIGNAANAAAFLYITTPFTAVLALTVAVSFGGLSVHLQAALFLEDTPISMHRYMAGKLLQATLACLCTVFFYRFL